MIVGVIVLFITCQIQKYAPEDLRGKHISNLASGSNFDILSYNDMPKSFWVLENLGWKIA